MTSRRRDGQALTAAEQAAAEAQAAAEESTALQEYNAEVLARQPGLREAFLAMLEAVPEPDDDAAARIVGTILEAEDAEDLDRPWDSDGMRSYFDQRVLVNAITKRPSDYEGGLGVYLGCQCTLPDSGETLFVSCGSVSAVAQLVRAHTLDALPLLVVPRPAKKATARGYWPYHLEIVKGAGNRSARAAAAGAVRQSNAEQAAAMRRQRILEEAREGGRVLAADEAAG